MSTPKECQSIRSLLARKLHEMRPAEQKVASLLLYGAGDIEDLRLEALAARAGVSPSAVVRMCHALGFDGFRTFRDRWMLEHSSPPARHPSTHRDHPLWLAIESLHQTADLIDPRLLAQAGERVRSAATVLVYGQGGSGYLARLTAAALTVTGRLAVALTESETASTQLPVDDETVLIVISHRGTNPAVCNFARRCRERGATAIVVTSGAKSPLAALADLLLLTSAPVEDDRVMLELSPARVVQMAVLQALIQASRSPLIQVSEEATDLATEEA